MRFPNSFYFSRWYRYWMAWIALRSMLNYRHHIERLSQLEKWAKRKRLRVQDHYRQRQLEMTINLDTLRMRHPHLYTVSAWAYCFWQQVRPKPIYRKGYAKIYNRSYYL